MPLRKAPVTPINELVDLVPVEVTVDVRVDVSVVVAVCAGAVAYRPNPTPAMIMSTADIAANIPLETPLLVSVFMNCKCYDTVVEA